MTQEEMRGHLRAEPFRPFRVIVKDGRTFDVMYPRMNLVAHSFVKIGIPEPGSNDPMICDHTEFVWLAEIDRIELLPTAAAPPATSSGT